MDKQTQSRNFRKPKKLDREKVKQLDAQGFKPVDIARHQNVSLSTVTRYLQKISGAKQEIKHYSSNKADILALSQAKSQTIQDIIQSAWLADPVKYLLSQDVRLQKEILYAVGSVKTYDHNQERLERNQATSIVDYRALVFEINTSEALINQKLKAIEEAEDAEIVEVIAVETKALVVK